MLDLPLEVVWSRVAVVSVGAERADVARRLVDQTVPDHLVFALEPLAAFAARATRDRAVVGPCRGVHVGVRVEQVLRLEWLRGAAGDFADVKVPTGLCFESCILPLDRGELIGWARIFSVCGCREGYQGC